MLTRDHAKAIRQARFSFLDVVEPHRPELFRYCRALTPSVWDADDLVQETLLRAFAKLGECHWDVQSPRSYLFRMATNLWIDRQRRAGLVRFEEQVEPLEDDERPPGGSLEVREALAALARSLPPQERAAVLLKDVFGLDLDEVAAFLETTRGAVKAALHRGRGKLAARGPEAAPLPGARPDAASAVMLDRFVTLFNARDLPGLTALLLEDATAEVVGMVQEYGREQIEQGSLFHTLFGEEGQPRAALVHFLGEPVVVIWYRGDDGTETLQDVLRFTERSGAIAELRYMYFCPEVVQEVGAALGAAVRTNGYRYKPR